MVLSGVWKQQVLENMGLDTRKHPTRASLHVGENKDQLGGTIYIEYLHLDKGIEPSSHTFQKFSSSTIRPILLYKRSQPVCQHTHCCHVSHYSLTLCWTRPYSRWGRSQKRKFCFFHSALKEGPFAEPNISSRKACERGNTQYALWTVCSPMTISWWGGGGGGGGRGGGVSIMDCL